MLKELLQEVVSNVDNRKGYRKLLGELMGNEEALKKMMEELKDFEGFQLPAATTGKE
jgi:type VI secretion system protein ImpB